MPFSGDLPSSSILVVAFDQGLSQFVFESSHVNQRLKSMLIKSHFTLSNMQSKVYNVLKPYVTGEFDPVSKLISKVSSIVESGATGGTWHRL